MIIPLKEAAERYWNIKPATARQQIINGRLNADKLGGRDWYVTWAEVRRYARESQHRELT